MTVTTPTVSTTLCCNPERAKSIRSMRSTIPLLCMLLATAASARSEVITQPLSLGMGIITCIPQPDANVSCSDPLIASDTGVFRVVLGTFLTGAGGGLDDVTVTLVAGSVQMEWTWSHIDPPLMETTPFNLSLLSDFTSLSISATLPHGGIWDPVSPDQPLTKFVADSTLVSATEFTFPPPLDFSAPGLLITTTPEPASIRLECLGVGLLVIVGSVRRRTASRKS